ncbi:uncharacterized protein LOC101857558 [Aplysia californica]|uniref:Betsin n=1 Tax=Aplysia californica TaxID=6500 RepID=A0A161R9N0_APLCA|nr:uncharacterized protein LOC101857558 [Aplysia californica]XP_005096264.1 uncharacterized protein LOC101857558 [Aplysia californica]ADX20592.1 betsin [Aplysia californica]
MEPQLLSVVILVLCACAASALPTNSRREDLSHLVTLLGKLKNIERARQNSEGSAQAHAQEAWEGPRVSSFPETEVTADVIPDEVSAAKGYLGQRPATGVVNKRQGAWSYDYGLGGGRFGKRSYGDYGIGGGRFGRDVDHVDLSDATENEITS